MISFSQKSSLPLLLFLATTFFSPGLIQGSSLTDAGLTLIQPFGARASAVGEAYSAATNDISALGYNPASLSTLNQGQSSFSFQRGLVDDSFGQIMAGVPTNKGGLGLTVGYYNGGLVQHFDGISNREVTAQRDLTLNLGVAHRLESFSIGFSGKYLSSELGDTYKATAYAADFGIGMQATPRLHFGASVQNIGTQLKFIDQEENLPRIGRVGASYLIPIKIPTTFLVDVPYHMNQSEFRPAVGLETLVGPLAFRAGYKQANNFEEFSVGTGFFLGDTTLDYAFGLVDQLDSQHRVSFSLRFGPTVVRPELKSQDPVQDDIENILILPLETKVSILKKAEDIVSVAQYQEYQEVYHRWKRGRFNLGDLSKGSKHWEEILKTRGTWEDEIIGGYHE